MTGPQASDPRTDPITDDLGWMLGVVFRAYLRAADHVASDLPGGPRGYQVLVAADREPARNQGAVAEELGIDRTVLTYLIDDLERDGLVVRRPDPVDRRSRLVTLTDAGRDAARRRREALAGVETRLLHTLTSTQCGELRDLLKQVACAAQADDPLVDLCQAAEAATDEPPTRRRRRRATPGDRPG
ncbi:MarR family winged helix-turn-helix transcriptional regulator [Micromonospora craniellae]|uniref:MarR family transcriptional regulator n=1 Tax=Micromonospora craniellae TaxID=2294034 RepID=A0A372FRI0_9ACTN|nr:MarR family winged helix-turn-helix transcriptional regulator [Micromonospora craniellae]QOC91807.1 winged helix-turn-helix transcriptional regulator [Micromonospora craniellae]RFS43224.1 MarR family transcriptional regulator [Micromonospora craniellae]